MKMTLNQLLVEMDGFEQNNGVIVIAATNFPDSLDSALTRPGRFDKHVDVPPPDIGGRKAILELYAKKIPVSVDVDMEQLARGTPGFSGADLYNLVNQVSIARHDALLSAVPVDDAPIQCIYLQSPPSLFTLDLSCSACSFFALSLLFLCSFL